MKKLADLLIVVGIFLISNVCFASISVDRIALGGISIDSSLKYVRGIYALIDGIIYSNFAHPKQACNNA